jgi:hypothetical protein
MNALIYLVILEYRKGPRAMPLAPEMPYQPLQSGRPIEAFLN